MSNKHDINHFTYRPVPRLLRYRLLLPPILETLKATGPPDHDDIETIPQVMELIDQLAKATQKGVAVNEAKVELWQFEHSLDGGKFGSRAVSDALCPDVRLTLLGPRSGSLESDERTDPQGQSLQTTGINDWKWQLV